MQLTNLPDSVSQPALSPDGRRMAFLRVSIADYANIYSHTHSIVDQRDVSNIPTVLEDGVRITYHATVLAGVRVRTEGMVGAMALVCTGLFVRFKRIGWL